MRAGKNNLQQGRVLAKATVVFQEYGLGGEDSTRGPWIKPQHAVQKYGCKSSSQFCQSLLGNAWSRSMLDLQHWSCAAGSCRRSLRPMTADVGLQRMQRKAVF